jgi:hypothetical protein
MSDKFIENVVKDAEELYGDVKNLLDGDITRDDIFNLIGSLVETVESFCTVSGEGEIKKQQVMDAFNYLDKKYGIVKALDKAVKWPFYLAPLEAVDGTAIKWVIEDWVIGSIVWGLNRVT